MGGERCILGNNRGQRWGWASDCRAEEKGEEEEKEETSGKRWASPAGAGRRRAGDRRKKRLRVGAETKRRRVRCDREEEVPAIWAEVDKEEARGALLLALQNEGFPPFAAPAPPPRLPRQRQGEAREREEEKGRNPTAPHQTIRQERKGRKE